MKGTLIKERGDCGQGGGGGGRGAGDEEPMELFSLSPSFVPSLDVSFFFRSRRK